MFKVSDLGGFLLGLLVAAGLGALVLWRVWPARPASPPPPASVSSASVSAPDCAATAWEDAARRNAASLYTLDWSPFGTPEKGWATYAPLISEAIGARCRADTAGFAQRLSEWQARQGLSNDGVLTAADFDRLRDQLALQRPFVRQSAHGACPAAASEDSLTAAQADETYGGKTVRLRPAALAAYRRMVAAARVAGVATGPDDFRLVSGFRGPDEEAARCADGGCNTVTRASCSSHRTGLALDLYLPPAPGQDPTSTDDANRRHMAASVEYRWLVSNAARFGFLPYAYEPWHWEWSGAPHGGTEG